MIIFIWEIKMADMQNHLGSEAEILPGHVCRGVLKANLHHMGK